MVSGNTKDQTEMQSLPLLSNKTTSHVPPERVKGAFAPAVSLINHLLNLYLFVLAF